MWPYPWTHVGTPSHLGHMDRVAATMPSQAHAGAAQEAPDIGQWEGQDVPLVRPSSCNVKGGIPSSRRYLPTYLCAFRELSPVALLVVPACPLRVCALALPRCPLPPPLGGVACAPRAVPALSAGRAVPRGPCPCTCPAPVPCSVWRAWGGAVQSRLPPTWLGAVVARGV